MSRPAQISLPIATAVSAMRLEKPHSLSYQLMTETRLPSITLVWSSAKLDEAGLWLKSMDDQRLVHESEHALQRAVGGRRDRAR